MILNFLYSSAFSKFSIISMCSFIMGGGGNNLKKLGFSETQEDHGVFNRIFRKDLKGSLKRREEKIRLWRKN